MTNHWLFSWAVSPKRSNGPISHFAIRLLTQTADFFQWGFGRNAFTGRCTSLIEFTMSHKTWGQSLRRRVSGLLNTWQKVRWNLLTDVPQWSVFFLDRCETLGNSASVLKTLHHKNALKISFAEPRCSFQRDVFVFSFVKTSVCCSGPTITRSNLLSDSKWILSQQI